MRPWLNRIFVVVGVALLWAAAPEVRAEPSPEFRRAQSLFEYGDYVQAIPLLEELVLPGRLTDEKEVAAAHRMLGVSYYQVGRRQEAAREFKSLLYLNPDATMDPFLTPPEVVEFFESVKRDMGDRLTELRELRAKEKAAREREAAARKAPPVEETPARQRVVVRKVRVIPPPILWLPLGIPQFLMGHWWRGAGVLALQLLAPIPSLGFLLAWQIMLRIANPAYSPFGGAGLPQDHPLIPWIYVMAVLQYASLVLIPAAWIVGVVDAHVLPSRETLENETSEEVPLPRPAPRPAPRAETATSGDDVATRPSPTESSPAPANP
ncbi:MAG: tetratricopeptide repeat protein [Myxococcota bacterium]